MGRRPSRSILTTFRNHFSSSSSSKIASLPKPTIPRTPISNYSQPIFRNPILQTLSKPNYPKTPFQRSYYVDRSQVEHFRARGYKRLTQNPRNLFIMVLIGSGVFITVYFGNSETVPYTKRTHFVILSHSVERQLGDRQFDQLKQEYKGNILPALHPDSIRVQRISQDIINGLRRGVKRDENWGEISYDDSGVFSTDEESMKLFGEEEKWAVEEKWVKEDEILDDKWVQQSRKKGKEKGKESVTSHLDGLRWEVIVVDEPVVNAFCLPGGKIVVFTGLLNHFKADAEVATIIGHEVGHVVARHSAEQLSKNLWLTILQLILYQFFMPDVINTMSNLLFRLPFSRRMEMEADYIGLLLIASSGYDPRVAPQVYEKLGKITGDSRMKDYLATHPSGRKRAETLAQAQVMEEALALYRDLEAGRGIEGFL